MQFRRVFFMINMLLILIIICPDILGQSQKRMRKKIEHIANKCLNENENACEKLKEIARYHKNKIMRTYAIEHINDQKILIEAVKNDLDYNVRQRAVKKITDQDILIYVANNDKEKLVRIEAVKRITDQRALLDIVLNNEDFSVQNYALKNITDNKILLECANKSFTHELEAISKITDQKILTDIIKNEKRNKQLAALSNIKDKTVLIDVINDKNNHIDVRWYALQLLKVAQEDYEQLIEILNSNINENTNLSILIALKILKFEKTLKKYYPNLEIKFRESTGFQTYDIGNWSYTDFIITVITDKYEKEYKYFGDRGSKEEFAFELNISHKGRIDINEICSDLLSPVEEQDLVKITKECEIPYLKETALSLLGQKLPQ
jgi:hypothetical protein